MKKNKKQAKIPEHCPDCGAPVELRSADGIYKSNPNGTMLYVCRNYPKCDNYVRTHPGTILPVGTLANARLRKLRNEAHYYFNQLYESGALSKDEAYNLLTNIVQAPRSKAHIGNLGEFYCMQVINKSQEILRNHGIKPRVKPLRHVRIGGIT